jgi:hypothetical protein
VRHVFSQAIARWLAGWCCLFAGRFAGGILRSHAVFLRWAKARTRGKVSAVNAIGSHAWVMRKTAAETVTCDPHTTKARLSATCFQAALNALQKAGVVCDSAPTGSSLLADLDHARTLLIAHRYYTLKPLSKLQHTNCTLGCASGAPTDAANPSGSNLTG